MKTASAKAIQELDRIAIEELGIKSLFLMENAGCSVSRIVSDTLNQIQGKRVNVICGKGNNAGDGFVAARFLINKKINTQIFMIGGQDKLKADALVNYNLVKEKHDIIEIYNIDENKKELTDCDLFVDAIFGIGLKGSPVEPFKSIIELVNQTEKPIIAVDIPSGLDATSGVVAGACIKATKTVTFSLAKRGFFLNQGPEYSGEVIVEDIGIPKELIDKYAQ